MIRGREVGGRGRGGGSVVFGIVFVSWRIRESHKSSSRKAIKYIHGFHKPRAPFVSRKGFTVVLRGYTA